MHLILLGDSTLDNAPYTKGGPCVTDHIDSRLGEGSSVSLLAVSGTDKGQQRYFERTMMPQGAPPPGAVGQTISGHCEMKTKAGRDCSRNGTEWARDNKSYCAQHADMVASSNKGSARKKILQRLRRKDGYYY